MSKKRAFGLAAVTAAVLGAGVATAPAAVAAPETATTLTRLIGSGESGSFGYGGALVNEAVTVRVDPDEPGISWFGGSMWCYCKISWTNITTGASGTNELPSRPVLGGGMTGTPRAETGSGRIVATVTVPNGFTYLPGVGTWVVP